MFCILYDIPYIIWRRWVKWLEDSNTVSLSEQGDVGRLGEWHRVCGKAEVGRRIRRRGENYLDRV